MAEARERLTAALSDRYRIERELGQGGMATVYLAEDLKHHRRVALKVLKPELAAVLGAERFVQEITTTANLSHPHILPLFDSGSADGFLYYVMPFIDGETLRDKLSRETQLSIDEAVRITCEVADALDYAHRHGVIHRDIKPENILLHDGRPMVADFGIALALSAAAGGRMTETGLSLGTPHYMSPEQATAEKELTNRSDIYSLGCVLYEMLTGNPPHTGASAQQIIMKIVTEVAPPVTNLRKAVPPNVAAAAAKAVERIPADRFETARAFAEALANPAFTYGLSGLQPQGTGAHAAGRRTSLLHWAATATLALGLVWALVTRGGPEDKINTPWLVDLGLPDSATFYNGMALSPDGSLLVYGGGPLEPQIWMRRAGMAHPTPIAGTAGGCCPALSPDGQRVAFVRGGELHQIPLAGGTSTLIGTGFSSNDDITWTADGYVVGQGGSVIEGLVRVPEGGGQVTSLTTTDSAGGEMGHWSPRALPGGRGILFTIAPWDQTDSAGIRIAVVGPNGGAHTVLMPGRVAAYVDPGYLLVTRIDGSLVVVPFDLSSLRVTGAPVSLMTGLGTAGYSTWLGYFAVARTGKLVYIGGDPGRYDLVWVRRTGAVAEVDSSGTGGWSGLVRVSPDGRVLAVQSNVADNMGIDIRDRESGASSRAEVPSGRVDMPSFTANSRSLVFRSSLSGKGGIFRAEVGRLGQRRSLLNDTRLSFPSLSPDERTLYFIRQGARGAEFVARALGDSASEEQVLASSINAFSAPVVSPDGRWLAYVATISGTDIVYVRSTDGSRTERWQVASVGGRISEASDLRWSRDGRELYFIARDSMVAAHVSGAELFTTGRLEALFSVRPYPRYFDIGPDGRFLFTRRRARLSPYSVMMLDDWRALMKGR
jgi:serine/threonine-protein kinase